MIKEASAMNRDDHLHQLIHILQSAYSGELAAALAYRSHWKSVRSPLERERIQQIEHEELVHREKVGQMLAQLQVAPQKSREVKMWLIGRTVGVSCYVIGWFLPMYFAGRLENGNVDEYDHAAFHADHLGLSEFATELRWMSEVEREHELFFMRTVAEHRLLPLMQSVFNWGLPEPPAVSEPQLDA